MSLIRFCLAVFIASICLQQEVRAEMSEAVSYRILDAPYNNIDNTIINYSVSIDRFLDRSQIGQIICQVIRDKKPASFKILTISIYYGLDKWIPGGPLFEREYREHIVAEYLWNISLPEKRDRLLLLRDAQGGLMEPPMFYDFDHTKACKKDKGQIQE